MQNNRKFFVIFSIVIIALAIDSAISAFADTVSNQAVTFWGITLFIIIAIVFGLGQYFILDMVKRTNKRNPVKLHNNNIMEKTMTVSQYVLTAIMIIVVSQIIVFSQYSTNLLTVATIISYGLTTFLMSLLTYRSETTATDNPEKVTTDKPMTTTTTPPALTSDSTSPPPPLQPSDTAKTISPDTTTPSVDCKTSPTDPSCSTKSLATHIDCTKNPDDPSCSTSQSLSQSKADDDCLFKPSLDKCKPINGKCPSGFGLNEDEQCFPDKPCPKGFERPDDDETGACLPITKTGTSDSNNTTPITDNSTNPSSDNNTSKALPVSVSFYKNPIVRGHVQTTTVTVSNNSKKIGEALVQETVKYVTNTTKQFSGRTDSSGHVAFSWPIGPNSNTGIFKVTAKASKDGYDSGSKTRTFRAISASSSGDNSGGGNNNNYNSFSSSSYSSSEQYSKYFREYTDMPPNSPLIITGTFMHKDILNDIIITGEIKNIGTTTANFVQLISTFYDVNNQTLANKNTYTQPFTLQPSQSAPFTMYLSPNNIPLNKIDHVKYHLDWRR